MLRAWTTVYDVYELYLLVIIFDLPNCLEAFACLVWRINR
jgi:hypothetical protein